MATFRERGDSWQAIIRLRAGGRLHQETKTFTGLNAERKARAWADKVEKELRAGGSVTRVNKTVTLGTLLEEYQEAREAVNQVRRGMAHELGQLHRALGHIKLAELRPEVFSQWAIQRRAECGASTVMHNLATLRAVLGAAKPMFGYDVSAAPVAEAIAGLSKLKVVSKSQSRDRRVTDAELGTLVAEFERIAGNPSTVIPMATIVRLAVALPRRLGELTGEGGMLWEDYKGGKITLRDTKNPTAPRTEVVPVPPAARKIIEALPKIDARILPFNSDSVSAAFDRACARLKIEDCHFHDLRHEGISRLFESGLQIQEVALISGHMSWNTLKRYTHLRPDDVLEKMNGQHEEALP